MMPATAPHPPLAGLNPSQREAVSTLSGPLLVLAGAGTGKTRVITHRIVELIRSGVRADGILSVTFTNKAAREMLERTRGLLGKRSKPAPVVSTFHSLCVRVLRREATLLGYPANFVIYARGEQESVARTALRDVRLGERAMTPGDLLYRIGRWKMLGVPPSRATDDVQDDLDLVAAVAYRKYQSKLRAVGAVDFDDLLMLVGQLFDEHPAALEREQARFSHVQIDEYQDTNGVQFAFVEALVRPHQNLCVVGDDDQSIYGWRGADVSHILGFASHFPNAKVVRLEDNYRCTHAIVEHANQLVRHNRGRHGKTLRAHAAGENVRFLDFPDEKSEAEGIVREISYLVKQEQVPPGEIAILFRTNEQPRAFETELRRKQIPYKMIGSQSFFDRREIKDLLAYLKVLANPADEVSLLRIVNTPPRGIGNTAVRRLLERAVASGRSLWDELPHAIRAGDVSAKVAKNFESFRDLLDRYRQRCEADPKRLPETLRGLIDEIDYDAEIAKQYKAADQQLLREEIVEQFVDAVREYAGRESRPTLLGFVEAVALLDKDEFAGDDEKERQSNEVKLLTLHSAKGLEFPRVYMVGLEEGILPHRRSVEAGDDASIAEERRLCYVGITRAERHLTLSRATSRTKWGKRKPSPPSRFLFEMCTEAEVEEMLAEDEGNKSDSRN
jgi:DNA helicase II / ATP-dependent DNA helicase PcrA